MIIVFICWTERYLRLDNFSPVTAGLWREGEVCEERESTAL